MPYPETPYGILIKSLADNLTAHGATVGETVHWQTYSNVTSGESGQHGGVSFNLPRAASYSNNELEIIVRTLIWRPSSDVLLKDAGNAFAFIDDHLRRLGQTGIRVEVEGLSHDLFKGWRVQSVYFPDDHLNIDQGRSLVLEWILIWQTEGLMRNEWDKYR